MAWRSRSSFTRSPRSWTSCSRSRSALIRSVTSRLMPTMRTGLSVRAADGLPHAANDADGAVCPPHPEIGPELAVAAERGLDVAGGTREVFRHDAPGPRVVGAAELLLANAVEPVHRVVPHEPVVRHVPVPDAEPGGLDGELEPVLARAQAGFAFLQLPLAPLPHLDFRDQIVERRLELAGHVVERLREAVQLLQIAARHPLAHVSASHGPRRARDVPERRGHHRRQRRGQHQGEHQRHGEHHRRAAAARACARQIERFRHGRDQDPVTACAVVAIRCRVGQPRFPRERLRRDVIEPELRRFGRSRRARVPGQRGNGALHDRVAVGRGRGDHRARSIEDEGSAIRADGLVPQQSGEAVGALGIRQRRRRRQVVVQPQADVRRPLLMEPRRQPRRIVLSAPQRDDRRGADHRRAPVR